MPKILVITCSAGRHRDSHTIRLRNYLIGLSELGYSIAVVAPDSSADDLPMHTSLERHEVGAPPFLRFQSLAASIPLIGRSLNWFFGNLFYRVLLPDQFCLWHKKAVKYIQKNNLLKDVDLIISASGSPEAHLTAASLSTPIPWIAEYGDPWHFVDYEIRPLLAHLSKRVEKRTLSSCAGMIVTTRATQLLYENWTKTFNSIPVIAIPYGFAQSDLNASYKSARITRDRFVISHVGTAHKSDRNLIPLIRAVNRLKRTHNDGSVELILAGKRSSAFDREVIKLNMEDVVLYQTVNYSEALALHAKSTIVVIVGNRSPNQVPGKIYSALASNNHILYVSQCPPPEDEAFRILSQYPGVSNCNNDEVELFRTLDSIYTAWRQSPVGTDYDRPLQPFESRELSTRIVKLACVVSGQKPQALRCNQV